MAGNDSAGSTNPFDFDDDPGSPDSDPSPSTAGGTTGDPFDFDTPAPVRSPAKVGQRLSWTALAFAVAGAIGIAVGIAQGLGSIRLQAAEPFGSMLWWGTCTLLGVAVCLVAVVLGFVAVVKAQPRTVAVIAFIVAVIIGWIAAYIGVRIGAGQLAVEVARVTGAEGPQAAQEAKDYLRERGIDVGPFGGLLDRLLG